MDSERDKRRSFEQKKATAWAVAFMERQGAYAAATSCFTGSAISLFTLNW